MTQDTNTTTAGARTQCEGHETTEGAIGTTVYCDGSCIKREMPIEKTGWIYDTRVEMQDAIADAKHSVSRHFRNIGNAVAFSNPCVVVCDDNGRMDGFSEPWFYTGPVPSRKMLQDLVDTVTEKFPGKAFEIVDATGMEVAESKIAVLRGEDSYEPTGDGLSVVLYRHPATIIDESIDLTIPENFDAYVKDGYVRYNVEDGGGVNRGIISMHINTPDGENGWFGPNFFRNADLTFKTVMCFRDFTAKIRRND